MILVRVNGCGPFAVFRDLTAAFWTGARWSGGFSPDKAEPP